ncbi:MAG: YhcH/YjgK/YiaL family protein [Muribaculaceae bacterium]
MAYSCKHPANDKPTKSTDSLIFTLANGRQISVGTLSDTSLIARHRCKFRHRWDALRQFLALNNLDSLPIGTINILPDGEEYAIISDYVPRNHDSCRFEAHSKYIDFQYIISGAETMGVTSLDCLDADSATEYIPEADIQFFPYDNVKARYATATPDTYHTFFPSEPHRPSINLNASERVRKLVVKILYTDRP